MTVAGMAAAGTVARVTPGVTMVRMAAVPVVMPVPFAVVHRSFGRTKGSLVPVRLGDGSRGSGLDFAHLVLFTIDDSHPDNLDNVGLLLDLGGSDDEGEEEAQIQIHGSCSAGY